MKIRSFRVRIAMLSVMCSCVALIGSSLVAWNIVHNAELRRIDDRIHGIIRHNLLARTGVPTLVTLDQNPLPPSDSSQATPPSSFFIFKERDGRIFYRSRYFPEGLNERDFDVFLPPGQRPTPAPETAAAPGTTSTTEIKPKSAEPGPLLYSPIREVILDGRPWRVGSGGTERQCLTFAVDLLPSIKDSVQVANAFLLSIPVALLLIALGAVFMSNRALRPVHELTRLARRVTASGLGERIEAPARDAEFNELILVFNQMMDRLERSFFQTSRFSADAAHELRTPLTILQGHLEQMLQAVEPGSGAQQELGDMLEEIHRIKSILEKLLLLARMDAGQVQLHLAPLDLGGLVENVLEDIQALAPGIAVEARIEPGIQVRADAALLETAIQNLGNNAIKYNLEHDGRILVELARHQGRARLAIANTGPKIDEAHRPRIFDRFYRADQSRSREVDGTGLGLSLAREIVLAHHGTLELVDRGDALNHFEITLELLETVARTPG